MWFFWYVSNQEKDICKSYALTVSVQDENLLSNCIYFFIHLLYLFNSPLLLSCRRIKVVVLHKP